MKRIMLGLLMVGLTVATFDAVVAAGEEPEYGWEKTAVAGVNFTQNSFDNWVQGGEDSWSWQLNLNAALNRVAEKYDWSNSLKTAFGKTRVGDDDSRKAVDELRFESVYTYKLGIVVDPYCSFSSRTQFAPGYTYTDTVKIQTSDLMDPTYLTEAVGGSFKPADYIKTRIGAAAKQTISKEYGYADDPETEDEVEDFKNEFGAELVTDINLKLGKNLFYTSRIEVFSTLESYKSTDVNWDNMFTAKVSEYINVSLNIRIFYDQDISPKRQISQTLAVGLTYTLF